jgi:hypothetical protein
MRNKGSTNMKSEIKYFHSPDVDPVETYAPPDKTDFCFLLQIIVAPEGQPGEESFDVVVCSPKWLLRNLGETKILIGRHHLIMNEYNYERLVAFIRDEFGKCSGKDWKEVAEKLGRIGQWEFEDYVPSRK